MRWMRWLALAVLASACSWGDNYHPPDAPPPDTGPDALTFPAFSPEAIQVFKGNGAVMAGVRLVPVFYANDALEPAILAGLANLPASQMWAQLTGEYSFGALTVATAVDLTATAPSTITDSGIQSFLASELDGTHPEWGPTDPGTLATTIYMVFYPPSTTITGGLGTSCVDYGAYHHWSPSGIIYGVMPRCRGANTADPQFAIVTHELFEAATDPFGGGYNTVRATDFAWAIANHGAEIGDMCQNLLDNYYTPPDVGIQVQREWSNVEARQFHDPCVPVPPAEGPYFATIPDQPDIITVNAGGLRTMSGVQLPSIGVRTIRARLASSAPTAAWTIRAVYAGNDKPQPIIFQFDKVTGVNGDSVNMTITQLRPPSGGYAPYAIVSTLNGRNTMWVSVVGAAP